MIRCSFSLSLNPTNDDTDEETLRLQASTNQPDLIQMPEHGVIKIHLHFSIRFTSATISLIRVYFGTLGSQLHQAERKVPMN